MNVYITEELKQKFQESLSAEGKSRETVRKYQRDLAKLEEFLGGDALTQEKLNEYKTWLTEKKQYKIRSANSFLSCANHFCQVMGQDFHVSAYKLHQETGELSRGKLSAEEYEKLATTAVQSKDSMIALVMQLLSVSDLRVTELFRLTVESLEEGTVEVSRGGEEKGVKLPMDIIADLKQYVQWKGYQSGYIFRTSNGKPVDRFHMWKKLKRLCAEAGVDEKKVSFQNLKRPLVREYYPVKL